MATDLTNSQPSQEAPTVAVVARQVGTANAFLPVIAGLEQGGASVLCAAFEPAAGALQRNGVACEAVTAVDQVLDLWQRRGPVAFVLCGTSEHATEDARLWGWAASQGIPHVAFVDSWVNYALRFTTPGLTRLCDLAPRAVAVPDEAAARRMVAAGCPKDRLVVTGNPAFDPWTRLDPGPGRRWREELLGSNESLLLSFVLEPLAAVYGDDPAAESYLGYTERDALALALEALAPVAADAGAGALVAVVPHPRQDPGEVSVMVRGLCQGLQSGGVRAEVIRDHDRFALVGGSDAVLGMTSTLLYEASLAGRPVVSLQPGRRQGSDLTDLHPEIVVVTEPGQARPALEAALAPRQQRRGEVEVASATERFLGYILGRI